MKIKIITLILITILLNSCFEDRNVCDKLLSQRNYALSMNKNEQIEQIDKLILIYCDTIKLTK